MGPRQGVPGEATDGIRFSARPVHDFVFQSATHDGIQIHECHASAWNGNAGTRGPGALKLCYLRIPSFWMTALYRSVSYFFK
jgi:hypothetical protein